MQGRDVAWCVHPCLLFSSAFPLASLALRHCSSSIWLRVESLDAGEAGKRAVKFVCAVGAQQCLLSARCANMRVFSVRVWQMRSNVLLCRAIARQRRGAAGGGVRKRFRVESLWLSCA